jgi:predicted nucleic acid-binding protein
MARYFFDSSALVKRYHRESGSAQVESLLAEPGDRFFISRLALVEVHSTFARLVREKTLNEADFARLTARLREDVASGLFTVAAVNS